MAASVGNPEMFMGLCEAGAGVVVQGGEVGEGGAGSGQELLSSPRRLVGEEGRGGGSILFVASRHPFDHRFARLRAQRLRLGRRGWLAQQVLRVAASLWVSARQGDAHAAEASTPRLSLPVVPLLS